MCSCVEPSMKHLKQAAVLVERSRLRTEYVPRFRSALEPVLEQEIRAAKRAADNGLDAWIEDFYPEQEQRVRASLSPLVRQYGEDHVTLVLEEIGEEDGPAALGAFSDQYTEGLAARWTNDSIAQLRQILRDEEAQEDVKEAVVQRLDQWEEGRADRTAQGEATQGAGAFAKHAMLVAGISRMAWRTVGESCPLCRSMEGRSALVRSHFLDVGDVVDPEGGEEDAVPLVVPRRLSHPPLHGTGKRGGVCDCLITAVL